ncbi:OTU domain-containing protein 5-like isoform X2 [Lycorma delicatula]|uniref:OTU domain-containing protein 5-like isoform X2 n=1 Tax=Lycorma delicatula TaxID=130591 RepID=UPI003F510977
MTILSKKKSLQGKSSEETSDAPTHHGGSHAHGLPVNSLTNQISERSQERLNSPQCWPREEKRSSHVSPGHGHYDDYDYDNLEGGPSHSKRRHRSSPHRVVRSVKLRDRDRVGHGGSSPKAGSSSPKAGPSSLSEDKKLDGQSSGSGYNSGDEYDSRAVGEITESEWLERDRLFEKRLRKRGLTLKQMGEDGACLFRAVADQVYGDQEMHAVVRKHCMDYIAANSDYFSQYVTEDFNTYVNRKRLDYTHGNHIEMQAMSEMYNRTIEVFCYGKEPINIFHGMHKTDNEPIRLSYQRGSHYNSIVDPHKATVGVGLGLPSFHPGAAEKNLLKDAVRQSEDFHIEQAMLEDKLRATDWEATNEAIEEQVARDSYLQWLRDTEKREKTMHTATATSTSAVATTTIASTQAEVAGAERASPARTEVTEVDGATSGFQIAETASFLNILPPQFLGLSEWEDAGILAQVLATSQQEYLDNLKKTNTSCHQTEENNDDRDIFGGPSTSR